jgi:hypothetical protein
MLANDGRHHWHEFRYLYATTFYTTTDLMQGVFDPGPAPVRTAREVAVWYSTEIFHIHLLKQLVNLFGLGLRSFAVIKTLYAAMIVLTTALMCITIRNLGMTSSRAALMAGLFLTNPLTVYLGFKLMGEVPSLLFATCALSLFSLGLRRPTLRTLTSCGAGVALTLSALCSAKMPILFLGFWIALLLACAGRDTRKPNLIAGLMTWSAFAGSLPVILHLLGGSTSIYLSALAAFLAFTKALPMWMFAIFNIGLVGLGQWLLLPLSWLSYDTVSRRFFLSWFIISIVPVLVIAAHFMEPRYLITVIIPFVGLAALGLEALRERLTSLGWRFLFKGALAGVLGVTVIGGTAVAQRIMPYETDAKQLIRAVEAEAPPSSLITILLPWNYSDFHFMRFLFPERSIYLVQSAVNSNGDVIEDSDWTAQFVSAYGDHFLPSSEALPAGFSERKLVYIGWTILPSLQNLHDFLICLGWHGLAERFAALPFTDHMTQSWLWRHPQFPMRESARYGQYRVYEVMH